MNSAKNARATLALTKLLRDELRDAHFSLAHLAGTDAEFVPSEYGGSTTTRLEETYKKEFNADGLRALHNAGAWKQDLFRPNVRVKALPRNPEIATRRAKFERLLDDLGILSDGHVAHALGPLLPGYHTGTLQRDSPEEEIGVAETADLWSYLLVDACLNTPRRTANKVLRWARGAHLAFETRVLLGRLHVVESFALANGLAVARLPRNSKDLDAWLPIGVGIAPSDYLDRTMLRIPCTIAPVLSKPTKVTGERDGVPLRSWNIPAKIKSTWQLPLGGVQQLTHALSLVCNVAVETPMIWTDYGDHAHFGERYSMSKPGTGEPPPRQASESPLTAQDLKEAIRLQPDLCSPPTDVQKALRYWLKSKARRTDVPDGLVYIRTALEALFLDDGNSAELRFRLATNGAWYTGRNRVERQDRFDVLKKVYSAASGAVHGKGKKKRRGVLEGRTGNLQACHNEASQLEAKACMARYRLRPLSRMRRADCLLRPLQYFQ